MQSLSLSPTLCQQLDQEYGHLISFGHHLDSILDSKQVEISSSLVASRYAKDKKVGEGTYAVVYAGTELSTGRKIAIKKIKVAQFKDGLDVSAIREVKALKELKHPNIIELIDVFSHKTNLNLVLEFLDADLEMIIKNKNVVFSAADIKSWMLMTLRGLWHCHRHFVLHRDLKPNNLLLASDGQLKLADFGLARDYADPHRVLTATVVTRWYRSPELLLGAQAYGYGVDIWAVGCIFAELMLRTPYLAGDTDIGQLQTIFRALGTPTEEEWPGMKSLPDYHEFTLYPRTPMRSLFTAASSDAIDLLENMLVYDPQKRITAEESLTHFYFRNQPKPTPPCRLPRDVGGQTHQYNLLKKSQDAFKKPGLPNTSDSSHLLKVKMDPQTNIVNHKRKANFSDDAETRKIAKKLF